MALKDLIMLDFKVVLYDCRLSAFEKLLWFSEDPRTTDYLDLVYMWIEEQARRDKLATEA